MYKQKLSPEEESLLRMIKNNLDKNGYCEITWNVKNITLEKLVKRGYVYIEKGTLTDHNSNYELKPDEVRLRIKKISDEANKYLENN